MDLRAFEARLSGVAFDEPHLTRRWIHGRGQIEKGLEDITLDQFGDIGLAFIHKPLEQEVKDAIYDRLAQVFPKGCLQDRSSRPQIEHRTWGDLAEQEWICDRGLWHLIFPQQGQNIGFFPDMEPGREWISKHAKGASVLNLFSYTCSLSCSALQGGAQRVVNVDMSGPSLEVGRKNHRKNDVHDTAVQYLKLNILKSWGRIFRKGPYDLVISDPPTQQKGSFFAENDYPKVFRRCADALDSNATLLACLNSPHHSWKDFSDWAEPYGWECVERLKTPDAFLNIEPEKGLKVGVWKLKS